MDIRDNPFTVTDWSQVTAVQTRGASGSFLGRSYEAGNLRVRLVEYAPGYVADHWCARGHVLLVLNGELEIELRDGTRHRLRRMMGFQAGDDPANPHRASSRTGARVFIVD